jgi:ABC-2 type transport system permease protein
MSKMMWAFKDTYWLAQRSILHITRSLDQVMSLIAFPIMFMLLTRYVLGGVIKPVGVTYANYLFAGILVQTLAFGANYTTINLAVDMKEGIVKRFRSLPMYNAAIVVGHVISDLVRNVISAVIIIIVGLLVGFRPNATLKEWLLVVLLGVVFTLAMSWVSAILGLLVNSLEAAQWIGFLAVLPLTFVSSSFVPIATMPRVLRIFAERQPVTHVVDTMRGWLVGTPTDSSAWLSFVWCFAIIVVCVPITAYLFKKRASKLGG